MLKIKNGGICIKWALKVTKVALQNAVSVAATILSTNAIITMARTYEDK